MLWSFLDPGIQVLFLFSFSLPAPNYPLFSSPFLHSTLLHSPPLSPPLPSQLCFSEAKLQFLRESRVMLSLSAVTEGNPPPPRPAPQNYFLGAVAEKGNEEQKRQWKTSGLTVSLQTRLHLLRPPQRKPERQDRGVLGTASSLRFPGWIQPQTCCRSQEAGTLPSKCPFLCL